MAYGSRVTHILDDHSMGGVTRALKNFQHPTILATGEQVSADLGTILKRADHQTGTAILHFTASWKKLTALAKLRGLGFSKIIMVEHTYTDGFECNCVSNRLKFRMMLRAAYKLVDHVVAVSQNQCDWILSARLVPENKVTVIAQARDCSNFLDLEYPKPHSKPLQLGAYGRFHEQKGFDLLIEAMAQIDPNVCQLRLCGYGDQHQELGAKCATFPHILIEPAFKCPAKFLSETDVVAIPSRWEAFGLVGAEARAAGRPLIAAKIDGLVGQIGTHSWSFEAGNVMALGDAILNAASSTNIMERGERARAHAWGEFDQMVKNWAGFLTAL